MKNTKYSQIYQFVKERWYESSLVSFSCFTFRITLYQNNNRVRISFFSPTGDKEDFYEYIKKSL